MCNGQVSGSSALHVCISKQLPGMDTASSPHDFPCAVFCWATIHAMSISALRMGRTTHLMRHKSDPPLLSLKDKACEELRRGNKGVEERTVRKSQSYLEIFAQIMDAWAEGRKEDSKNTWGARGKQERRKLLLGQDRKITKNIKRASVLREYKENMTMQRHEIWRAEVTM